MALTDEEIARVRDLFGDVGPITTRRMFGGLGIYRDDTIFALMRSDGAVMIKGAGDFRRYLEDLGCERWSYTRKDGAATAMPYWALPDDLYDDPEAASALARAALEHL